MKTLVESLFDKDIIQKDVKGYQLKDVATFDGQWVSRIKRGSQINFDIENVYGNNVLEVLDWKKIRTDLRKYKGDKIDLGMYPYAGADNFNIKNVKTDKKTEALAKLIMSIPFVENFEFGKINREWADKFLLILNNYILPEFRASDGNKSNGFYWKINISKYTLSFSLRYGVFLLRYGVPSYNGSDDQDLIRLEFAKNFD